MISKEFLTAGCAIFTVSSPTGEYYTYQVKAVDLDIAGSVPQTRYFVRLLTGPDNENDYTYLGELLPGTGWVQMTRASKLPPESKPVAVVRWACRHICCPNPENPFPADRGYKIEHCGYCGRCGRTLTTPESIERGLGPVCAAEVAF